MNRAEEFLKECRVNGSHKIDTSDDSFWRLKDLLEHYEEQYLKSQDGEAKKYDKLAEMVAKCYEDGSEADLCDIGELTAVHFGWL